MEFVDIAGLVAGASKGEGLGNQFLANIRETDAIVHVVRCFEDDNVIHVAGNRRSRSRHRRSSNGAGTGRHRARLKKPSTAYGKAAVRATTKKPGHGGNGKNAAASRPGKPVRMLALSPKSRLTQAPVPDHHQARHVYGQRG
jgi:hypothetical protein